MQRLLCLLSENVVSKAFGVEINENRDVDDLKQIIWEMMSPLDSPSVPLDLKLWSVNLTNLEWKGPVQPAAVEKTLMVGGKPVKHYTLDSDKKPKWCIKVLVERDPKTGKRQVIESALHSFQGSFLFALLLLSFSS